MASVFPRRKRLWCKVKMVDGRWKNFPTPYNVGQEVEARRYAVAAQRKVHRKRVRSDDGPMTVRRYVDRWTKERESRGVRSAPGERSMLTHHAVSRLGQIPLDQLRPEHVRDLVRELRAGGRLAARTIGHVYGTLHTMMEDAVTEGRVQMNPIRVKRGELPQKVDKDPEWRSQATFTPTEVEALIGDPRLPPERRVMWALKALAGLRHGEAAALRWRHYDPSVAPLGRLTIAVAFDSHAFEEKRTKTQTTRYVPVHPALAEIFAVWRGERWVDLFGRIAGPSDLIVPSAVTDEPVNKNDACGAFKHDLRTLGLRVEAGTIRARGGHDLRSWFKTQTIEDGADSDIIRRTTHAPPRDVDSGYKRFTWATYCREVAKLRISPGSHGGVLSLGTQPGTRSGSYGPREGNYWRNGWRRFVEAPGVEPGSEDESEEASTMCSPLFGFCSAGRLRAICPRS